MPYHGADDITAKVQAIYRQRHPHLTPDNIDRLRTYLEQEAKLLAAENADAIDRANARIDSLKAQRKKLLHLYYSDRLDDEMYDAEQARLDAEERQARQQLATAQTGLEEVAATVKKAAEQYHDWPTTSQNASDKLKQSFHDLFHETTIVYADDTTKPEPAAHTTVLLDAVTAIGESNWQPGDPTDLTIPNRDYSARGVREAESTPDNKEPAEALAPAGSRMSLMVGAEGLEPCRNRP